MRLTVHVCSLTKRILRTSSFSWKISLLIPVECESIILLDLTKSGYWKCKELERSHFSFFNGTNADLRISLYVWIHLKIIPLKFRILNPNK